MSDDIRHHGLDHRLRDVAEEFDSYCASNDIPYTIERDEYNEQDYFITSRDLDNLMEYMDKFVDTKWVVMEVNPNKYGTMFSFKLETIQEYPTITLEDIDFDVIHGAIPPEDLDAQLPIHVVQVESLWDTHHDHPHIDTMGDNSSVVVALSNGDKIKPILIDRQIDCGIYPSGMLLDGFKRLSAYRQLGLSSIPAVYVDEVMAVAEDQYKTPTSRLSRSFAPRSGSSINPSKTFGGHSTTGSKKKKKKKKKKKTLKNSINQEYKLKKPLLAHDNVTIIPKGATVMVVDDDISLPDIMWNGRIINVDRSELDKCVYEDLERRLNRRIAESTIGLIGQDIIGTIVPTSSEVNMGSSEVDVGIGAPELPGNSPAIPDVIATLNELRSSEIISSLQYELYAVTVPSMHMHGMETVFNEHLDDERKHALMLAKRIHELGGQPVADPTEIGRTASVQIMSAHTAEEMVHNLRQQEEMAIQEYKKAISMLGDDDPTTRRLLEDILAVEEEHATDFRSMLESNN